MAESPGRMVWTVAGLVRAIADALGPRFGACVVQGEISGLNRAASGHCYFNLKDRDGRDALLRCVMFRRAGALLDFEPADGMAVQVRGRLTLYESRGDLQLVVEALSRVGEGALLERFLRLKAQLEAEGVFDAARKRPLPAYPRRIGVVTSPDGAALHDVLAAVGRRAPHVEVIVYPSLVQGTAAPESLLRALAVAGVRREADVLLVCRGGGSMEDLWAFNDARVVRAIAASPVPLVAGIGHESDVTLSDFAADLRAPTPTAAAELAAPARAALTQSLLELERRVSRCLAQRLDGHQQRLDHVALRLAQPAVVVERHRHDLALLERRRFMHLRTAMQSRASALSALAARLESMDPRRVVARGYAIVQTLPGELVTAPEQLHAGVSLRLSLAHGHAAVRLQSARRLP